MAPPNRRHRRCPRRTAAAPASAEADGSGRAWRPVRRRVRTLRQVSSGLRRGPARPAGDCRAAPRTQVHPHRQSDPRGGLARGNRRANDRGRGARPHRPQRLSHRAQGRVPAQAQQAAATRRWRRQQSPGLKAGVHGRLRRLPGCKGGGARRHAECEGLPPRPAGRLHAQEASHTLGSGWHRASPPTSPRGGSHRQIGERQRAGARPRHGQVLPEPRSDKIRTGGQINRNPHLCSLTVVARPLAWLRRWLAICRPRWETSITDPRRRTSTSLPTY